MQQQLTEQQLEQVYSWVDEIPLSRTKKNMSRDFSDAVLLAEIIEHLNPKLVELHNYPTTGAVPQKIANWATLNRKVLGKFKLALDSQQIESLANCQPGLVERLVYRLKKCIESGEIPSPSVASKATKGHTSLSFGSGLDKPRAYHKMGLTELKKLKDVKELLGAKDEQMEELKSYIKLLTLKSFQLKDRQIEQILQLIKKGKKL